VNTNSVEITAGLGGFLVVFALGLALWLIGRDLTRRLRRMRLAEDERVARERERSASSPDRAEEPPEEDPLA
jgi:hypothetical protein